MKEIIMWFYHSLCRMANEYAFEYNMISIGIVLIIGLIFSVWFYRKYKNDESKSHQLINSLPNLWTSLGLLGTFISIVFSLGDINNDVQIVEIIKQIMPAFTTSIVGLIGAVISTIINKFLYRKEEKKIYASIERKTPEEILSEINGKLNSNIAQQNDLLIKFLSEFTRKMNEIFAPIEGQVKEYSKDLIEKVGQNQQKLINKEFEETRNGVRQSVESLNNFIDKSVQDLKETYKFYSHQLDSLTVNYKVVVALYSDAVKNAQQNNSRISDEISVMNDGFKSVKETNNEISKVYNLLLEKQDNIEKLTNEIKSIKSSIEILGRLESQLNKLNLLQKP